MTKKKKKKEKNNLFLVIVGVIAVIAIIAGSTYAYWSWSTDNTNQRTNVSVTVKGATLVFTGTNVTSATLRPTNDCDGPAALIGEATVTVVNETATNLRVTPRLDVTLTPQSGRTFDDTASNPDLSHLHWALVETNSSGTILNSKSCSSPAYQGTFFKVGSVTVTGGGSTDVAVTGPTVTTMSENTMATINITNMNASHAITDTLTFVANKATTNAVGVTTPVTTTKYYRIYVWLDDGYQHVNIGNSVTDPMQDLRISVKWSNKSTMVQE